MATENTPSGTAADLLTQGAAVRPSDASGSPPDTSGGEVPAMPEGPSVSAAQAQEMAAALIAAGIPSERVAAALKADGYEAAPADTRTDEQKEFDRAFGAPTSPDEYHVNYMGRVPDDADPATIAEFNTQATQWAQSVGLPVELGAGVIERALEVGRTVNAMNPEQRKLWVFEQKAEFERQAQNAGANPAEWIAQASKTLGRGSLEFRELLHKVGALDDPFIVRTLANMEAARRTRG